MKPSTYEAVASRKSQGKFLVLRSNVHYPNGTIVPGKHRGLAAANYWIERQVAEDSECRARRVADYLVERSARPATVAVDDGQLILI
jgi:hypothetical protein